MTRKQISELKANFIEQRQEFMKKNITASERKLYDQVFNKVISKLELDGDIINSSSKNLNIASDIDAIYKEFNKTEYVNIIKQFSTDLSKIVTLNTDYFTTIIDEKAIKRFDSVKKDVKGFMGKRIGINSVGEIAKDSYLDRLIKDETLKNSVKEKILKGITNKTPLKDLVKSIETTIVGNENIDGGLLKHFNQNMHDTYNQFDRTTSMMFAEKLELKFFVYQGGKIKTSRLFCLKHDNNCYTTEDASKWKREIGIKNSKGKPTGPIADKSTYNPLVDCGGFRCRHSLDYISDGLARKYRPELFT